MLIPWRVGFIRYSRGMIPVSPFGLRPRQEAFESEHFYHIKHAYGMQGGACLRSFLLEDLGVTLPETNISHLKMVGWKMKLLGIAYFQVLGWFQGV